MYHKSFFFFFFPSYGNKNQNPHALNSKTANLLLAWNNRLTAQCHHNTLKANYLSDRSRANGIHIKSFKCIANTLTQFPLQNKLNSFKWSCRSSITQSDKPFNPSCRCQIRLPNNLCNLIEIQNSSKYKKYIQQSAQNRIVKEFQSFMQRQRINPKHKNKNRK